MYLTFRVRFAFIFACLKNATKISPALEASWIWYHCTGILSKLQCTLSQDIRDLKLPFCSIYFHYPLLKVLNLNALYGRKRHQEVWNMFLPLCSVQWQYLVFTRFTFSYKNISAFFASFLRSLLKKIQGSFGAFCVPWILPFCIIREKRCISFIIFSLQGFSLVLFIYKCNI